MKGAGDVVEALFADVAALLPHHAQLALRKWKVVAASASRSAAIPRGSCAGIQEFAAQQAESVQEAQREQFATLTLNTAVELTAAALQQVQPSGGIDEQAVALRDAMRVLFPEGGCARERGPPRVHARRVGR